jgi:hypothetical protein
MKQKVSLVQPRDLFRQRLDALPGHGLTHTRMRGRCGEQIMLAPAFSVLTHPKIELRCLNKLQMRVGSPAGTKIEKWSKQASLTG